MGRPKISSKTRNRIINFFYQLNDNRYSNIKKVLGTNYKNYKGVKVSSSAIRSVIQKIQEEKKRSILEDLENTQITMDIYNIFSKYDNRLSAAYAIQKYIKKIKL